MAALASSPSCAQSKAEYIPVSLNPLPTHFSLHPGDQKSHRDFLSYQRAQSYVEPGLLGPVWVLAMGSFCCHTDSKGTELGSKAGSECIAVGS